MPTICCVSKVRCYRSAVLSLIQVQISGNFGELADLCLFKTSVSGCCTLFFHLYINIYIKFYFMTYQQKVTKSPSLHWSREQARETSR